MTYTITRDAADKDARYLRDALDVLREIGGGINNEATGRLRSLARQIEEQVKPSVEEPTQFGSIVRAGRGGSDRVLWQVFPSLRAHYWLSETGIEEVWSELTDVEVLRVGLGEPSNDSYRRGFEFGMREMSSQIHAQLVGHLDNAIGAERKNAIERMITVVEELAP